MRYDPGVGRAGRRRLQDMHGIAQVRTIPSIGWHVLSTEGRSAEKVRRELLQDPRVEGVELDYEMRALEVPNDPLWTKEQHSYLEAIGLDEAWDGAKGDGTIRVAVVDTGVDLDHPDLVRNIHSAGKDFIERDAVAWDDNGHGTMVAGVIAAESDNGKGIAGTAWRASILPVKVLDDRGIGHYSTTAAGITWAADHGAQVINVSLGGLMRSDLGADAVAYARRRGALVIASAGNSGDSFPRYPAAYPGVMAVGATDWTGDLTWFSSHGPWVDLVAPGFAIRSTDLIDDDLEAYSAGAGTSFAAPMVSGVAVLLWTLHPEWSADQVAERLRRTAQDAGPRGIDPLYRHGILDAGAAVSGTRAPPFVAPRGSPSEPNDTPARATSLGSSTTETISPQGDVDWFVKNVSGSGYATFEVQSVNGDYPQSESGAVRVDIYDSRLGFLDGGIEGGHGIELHVPVRTSGPYYVRVKNVLPSRTPGIYHVVASNGPNAANRFAPFQRVPLGAFAELGVPDEAETVAIGDVTDDGRNDLIVGGGGFLEVYVVPQEPDGSLGRSYAIDTAETPWRHTRYTDVGDLDGDGDNDLAVTTDYGLILLYQRNASLSERTVLRDLGQTYVVDIVDMEGDGSQEILVHGSGSPTQRGGLLLLESTSSGFVVAETLPANYTHAGDVDSDGLKDLIGLADGQILVLRQTPQGAFVERTYPGHAFSGAWVAGMTVADVTSDGRDDLLLTYGGNAGKLKVFPQQAGGGFGPSVIYPTYDLPEPVRTTDVDADGDTDVVIGHEGYALGVLYQQRDGTLGAEELYRSSRGNFWGSQALAVGDFSGDRRVDVALADTTAGLVVHGQLSPSFPPLGWVRGSAPPDFSEGHAGTIIPSVGFERELDAGSVSPSTVTLVDADADRNVPSTASYASAGKTVYVEPDVPLAPGAYEVVVDGIQDSVGTVMPEPYRFRFTVGRTVDTASPNTFIRVDPPPLITTSEAWYEVGAPGLFEFLSSEPGSTFQCSLDGGQFGDCSSPWYDYELLGGTHTFRVRATDAAGNVDSSPAARTWTYDPSLPPPANDGVMQATVISGEQGSLSGTNVGARWDGRQVGGDVGGATVWYRWSAPRDGTLVLDTSGSDFDTLLGVYEPVGQDGTRPLAGNDDSPPGRHSRLEVDVIQNHTYLIAVDGFSDGYWAETGRFQLSWSLGPQTEDSEDPVVYLTAPADGEVVGRDVSMKAFATDNRAVQRVEFLADGEVVGSDDSAPYELVWHSPRRRDGEMLVTARAYDGAGNVTTATPRSVVVDHSPPDTLITQAPSTYSRQADPYFSFSSPEPTASFECRAGQSQFFQCHSPFQYSVYQDGRYAFEVRAVDSVGNADPSPARHEWTLDRTDPALSWHVPPTMPVGSQLGAVAVPLDLRWQARDATSGLKRIDVQRSRGGGPFVDLPPTSPGATSTRQRLDPGISYSFRAKPWDRAGNAPDWVAHPKLRLTALQENDRAISYRGDWRRLRRDTAYGGYLMSTSDVGASASLPVRASGISLASSRGPRYGRLRVSLDGQRLAVIDLHSSAKQPRRIVFHRRLEPNGLHRLSIKVLPSSDGRRSIHLDAFIMSHLDL